MTVIWEQSGEAYYATVTAPSGEVAFHLIVESVGGYWDWAVWRPDEGRNAARHGIAATVQEAMREAERATRD
jgi:hypothetical protein